MLNASRQRFRRVLQEVERSRNVIEVSSSIVPQWSARLLIIAFFHVLQQSFPILGLNASITSAYVPPLPDLNIPLQPLETATTTITLAHRIKKFDHVFRHLVKTRGDQDEKANKKNRKVSFNPTAKVILIASRQEYHDAKLAELLWYTKKELKSFQQEARREMRQMLRYNFYTQKLHSAHSVLQHLVLPPSAISSTTSSTCSTPTLEYEEEEYSEESSSVLLASSTV